MPLTEFHRYDDGAHSPSGAVRWRVVPDGVEIEGHGLERTKGAPKTVLRVWDAHADAINRTARSTSVPCALIVATICTESGGRADAVRLEPGYVSDEKTPQRVSAGLMQTLISTARESYNSSVDRAWLLVAANSITAGTSYIARQARVTRLDPPLVAAAYNAGGLYHQGGAENRWKLRQYPIGTGNHVDRFVRFFNDAMAVMKSHRIKPTVGLDELLRKTVPRARTSGAPANEATPDVVFAPGIPSASLSPYSVDVVRDVLRSSHISRAVVSSTARTPRQQARVMYENLERHGADAQKRLYGPAGDKVIGVYVAGKERGRSPEQLRSDMEAKIRELGPRNVSLHASQSASLNVFDIAPSSISDRGGFEQAARRDRRIRLFLVPPLDPAYHLEIPQPPSRDGS